MNIAHVCMPCRAIRFITVNACWHPLSRDDGLCQKLTFNEPCALSPPSFSLSSSFPIKNSGRRSLLQLTTMHSRVPSLFISKIHDVYWIFQQPRHEHPKNRISLRSRFRSIEFTSEFIPRGYNSLFFFRNIQRIRIDVAVCFYLEKLGDTVGYSTNIIPQQSLRVRKGKIWNTEQRLSQKDFALEFNEKLFINFSSYENFVFDFKK